MNNITKNSNIVIIGAGVAGLSMQSVEK